jgi:hypothetical protein
MISHDTLYTLANTLGIVSVFLVVGYHVVAVSMKQSRAQ